MIKKIDLTSYHMKILNLWQYQNKTDIEIANIIGICSDSVIRRYRHKHNIIRLYKNEEWLKEQFETRKSSVSIAKKINCDPSCIQKAFKKLGLTNNVKNKVEVNNIFKNYTPESCYWSGFVNADGHIDLYQPEYRKTINYKLGFTISKKDAEHLKKLISTLGYTSFRYGKSTIRNKINENIQFATNKKEISIDLINKFNIIPGKKSCSESMPTKLPKQYMRDYIRGYFDGDGSVGCYNNNLKVVIVAGREFCKQLKDFLSSEKGESVGHIYQETPNDIGNKNNLYRYCIFKQSHIKWFYNYIYLNKDCVMLERKYDIFYNYYNKI